MKINKNTTEEVYIIQKRSFYFKVYQGHQNWRWVKFQDGSNDLLTSTLIYISSAQSLAFLSKLINAQASLAQSKY